MSQDLFLQEYAKSGNPLWFLAKVHALSTPSFIADDISRGGATGGSQLKECSTKGLYQMLVNRCASRGRTGGNKSVVARHLFAALSRVRTKLHLQHLTLSQMLLKAFVNSSPDRLVISSRYGSGVLTRAVAATFPKRCNFFMKTLTKKPKGRTFATRIAAQVESAINMQVKSALLTAKKEMDNIAAKANIQ